MISPFYTYHSFPRLSARTPGLARAKGLQILRSIIDVGLLMTPEVIQWPNLGTRSELLGAEVMQRRVCFTYLDTSELPHHSAMFGEFSLEFEPQILRRLGGIPVLYFPVEGSQPVGFEAYGATIVRRLAEAQELAHIVSTAQIPDSPTGDGMPGWLERMKASKLDAAEIEAAIGKLASYLYVTDDPERRERFGELHYYRQREWRIAANVTYGQFCTSRQLTPDEGRSIVGLYPDFFEKQLISPTQGRDPIINWCHVLTPYDGNPILKHARRLIAPKESVQDVESILNGAAIDIEVVALDEIA